MDVLVVARERLGGGRLRLRRQVDARGHGVDAAAALAGAARKGTGALDVAVAGRALDSPRRPRSGMAVHGEGAATDKGSEMR